MTTAFRLRLPIADEDVVATALWELDTQGFECRPGSAENESEILAYFPAEPVAAETLARLRAAIPSACVESVDLPDVDWVARFREGFRPFEAGGFLIAPVWDIPSHARERPLVVDPGRAFGTGTHESTRLCLHLLRRIAGDRPLGRVADVGTGTAILAIAAARLGASFVVASDIDPEALVCARAHLRLNQMTRPVRLLQADLASALLPRQVDTLVANISRPILVAHAPALASLFSRQAILAGLLLEDLPEVKAAYAEVDHQPAVEVMGEWAALLLTRRGRP
jgi:ribosomal protein L11 methyltransferase